MAGIVGQSEVPASTTTIFFTHSVRISDFLKSFFFLPSNMFAVGVFPAAQKKKKFLFRVEDELRLYLPEGFGQH